MSTPVLDLSGLTLNTAEAQNESQIIAEIVYAKPELNAAHKIMTGIKMDQQIPIFGLLGLVGKLDSSCSALESSEQIATSEKKWEPKVIGFRLPHCQRDIDPLFKLWQVDMKTAGLWDSIENPMVTFLDQRVIDASVESQLRISAFGDTSALNVSGGGVITNGVSVTFFTMLDGMWKQVFTAVTGDSTLRIEIPENDGVSYSAQDNLSDDRAYSVLKALYNGADPRLKNQKDKVFEVTRSLADNLEDYLEAKNLNAGFLERTENGKGSGLTYRGVPIIVRDDWDRNIRAYFDNGTTYDKPHRAVFTTLGNIPIGTADEGALKSLDMFYDKTDRMHYIDVDYTLDVKVLENYLMKVAY